MVREKTRLCEFCLPDLETCVEVFGVSELLMFVL